MMQVQEIEAAIESLPREEFVRLRNWFLEKDWADWDEQIEADSASGKLDFLIKEAQDAKSKYQLRDL
jgi:hypothetical protein